MPQLTPDGDATAKPTPEPADDIGHALADALAHADESEDDEDTGS